MELPFINWQFLLKFFLTLMDMFRLHYRMDTGTGASRETFNLRKVIKNFVMEKLKVNKFN